MTPFNMYREIGIPFAAFFVLIGFYLVYAGIKVIGETPRKGGMEWVRELFCVEEDVQCYTAWLDNRVDRVWLEYEVRVSHLIGSVGGCVNATILVGFFGTILGAILAFKDMGQGLSGDQLQVTEAIRHAFEGGLNTALYTSLLSSIIGGAAIGIMAVFIHPRVKRFEVRISDEIGAILKEANVRRFIEDAEGESCG